MGCCARATPIAERDLVHIAALIDRRAAERPDSIAVECGNQELTYADLVLRANQLADLLIELGVGPNALVAVHCGRSVELVVSELAVLKAGVS